MKIIQHRSKCIGCGSCAAVCDQFFEMGSDGFATLKGAVQTGEDLELEVADAGCAKEAAGVCPVQIIEVQ